MTVVILTTTLRNYRRPSERWGPASFIHHPLMPEVSRPRQRHHNTLFVRSINDFLVPHRATRLHHCGGTRSNHHIETITEREECIRSHGRTGQLQARDLEHLFALSPAEARLASRLADGAGLDEAAAILGISRNTARSQLQAIYGKTGVNRQGDLVRLLLNSAAAHARVDGA